jgi:uncharacterized protein YukE
MAGLEPLLPYDTYGMDLLAATLQKHAQSLDSAGSQTAGASSGMTFDGPAGTRIKDQLTGWSTALTGAAQQLQAAAGQLTSSAQQISDENAAITRHNESVLAKMTPIERKLVETNY